MIKKKAARKKTSKKMLKNHCRSPSNKSKDSKVKKLMKLAKSGKKKKKRKK